jgi:hypothetical protein
MAPHQSGFGYMPSRSYVKVVAKVRCCAMRLVFQYCEDIGAQNNDQNSSAAHFQICGGH